MSLIWIAYSSWYSLDVVRLIISVFVDVLEVLLVGSSAKINQGCKVGAMLPAG